LPTSTIKQKSPLFAWEKPKNWVQLTKAVACSKAYKDYMQSKLKMKNAYPLQPHYENYIIAQTKKNGIMLQCQSLVSIWFTENRKIRKNIKKENYHLIFLPI
jgi:hypothetical protein